MSAGELQAYVLEHADALDDMAEWLPDGTGHRVAIGETVAAILEPDALEIRLRPAVADAALRTSDVSASARGRGWVRFAPAEVDGFARDRALAWLESSLRYAAEGDAAG